VGSTNEINQTAKTDMPDRIAFFTDAEDLKKIFDLDESREVIFDPHYNLSRGHHIPVIMENDGAFTIDRIRWGKGFEKQSIPPEKSGPEGIAKLEKQATQRALMPISGFYIWKDEARKDHPFFVRKIDNTLLYVASFINRDQSNEFSYAEMIIKDANTLIQPISETMPCMLKEDLAKEWLRENISAKKLLNTSDSQFLITDLTVHRVTKDVKDLSNNSESLIQPIPK